MRQSKNIYLPYLMWVIPLLFFSYQFILRLWPSLLMEPIMKQFAIDATSFGFLASVYYLGYAGMQIPIAILIDKFGPKYILFFCTIICGIATLSFAYSGNWYCALLSRFLIGVGSAAGFLTVSKVISQWFPKSRYGQMVGLSFGIGLIGAIYGGKPISTLIEYYGMHNIATMLALASIIIGGAALIFLKTKEKNEEAPQEKPMEFADLLSILTSPALCFIAIANLLMVGSLEGFADIWGVNYLMKAYAIKKEEAAGLTSFIFVGMICGGPLLAFIGYKIGNFTTIIACGIGMTIAFFFLVYFGLEYNYFIFRAIFLLIGVMCCYQVLIFSVGSEIVSLKHLGITIAFLNCVNMFGGSFFHTVIGNLMDTFWEGEMNGEIRIYGIESYNYALSIIPLCAILGSIIIAIVALSRHKKK